MSISAKINTFEVSKFINCLSAFEQNGSFTIEGKRLVANTPRAAYIKGYVYDKDKTGMELRICSYPYT